MSEFGLTFKDRSGKVIDPKHGLHDIPRQYIIHLEQQLAELKAENERLSAQLSERDEKLCTQLSGQTCFVPPEFQQLLDEAMAHNSMLVDLFKKDNDCRCNVCSHCGDKAREALNATASSIQQWLDKRDAEVRKKAIPNVDWLANVIRTADGRNNLGAGALAEIIVARLTVEAKLCASTAG